MIGFVLSYYYLEKKILVSWEKVLFELKITVFQAKCRRHYRVHVKDVGKRKLKDDIILLMLLDVGEKSVI